MTDKGGKEEAWGRGKSTLRILAVHSLGRVQVVSWLQGQTREVHAQQGTVQRESVVLNFCEMSNCGTIGGRSSLERRIKKAAGEPTGIRES